MGIMWGELLENGKFGIFDRTKKVAPIWLILPNRRYKVAPIRELVFICICACDLHAAGCNFFKD